MSIATNWNSVTSTNDNTNVFAQIKIRGDSTLINSHVKGGARVHIQIIIRLVKSESMHGSINVSEA